MRGERDMSVRLMLEQVFADGAIANTTRKLLSGTNWRKPFEERMNKSVDGERVAEMSLAALLYHVLIGDGRNTDEFA
jgi:hypothetical protein